MPENKYYNVISNKDKIKQSQSKQNKPDRSAVHVNVPVHVPM